MISVILPCLNEEEGLKVVIPKIFTVFKKNNLEGEVIVVDNGSEDHSSFIAESLGALVIQESRRGYGNAYLAGFNAAKGDIIVMGDADNSYDFNEIPKFLKYLRNYDLVIGNRKYIQKNSMPFLHKHIGNPLFSFLLRHLFKIDISDSHCGFGAIKKSALHKLNLKSSGMEFASEILIKAKKNNLKIKEIPITYYPRMGKSKLRSFRDGFRHLRLILREFYRENRYLS